jgi:hypothetical protein
VNSKPIEFGTIDETNCQQVILCEGAEESAFLKALLIERNIKGFFVRPAAWGNTDFTRQLDAIKGTRPYTEKFLIDVVLVSDNDANPQQSFSKIQKAIKKSGDYPIPTKPYYRDRRKPVLPMVSIIMMPDVKSPGCFEGLVLRALSSGKNRKYRKCLDTYLECTPASKWSASKRDKMLLHCIVAATCQDDPRSSLALLWTTKRKMKPFLLQPCFNRISKFLERMAAAAGTA